MQYSFSALALVAFIGLAQAAIPECAATCIADGTASATTCGADDLKCQCAPDNMAAITTAATACVISACTDPIAVLNAVTEDCKVALAAPASSAVASASSAVESLSSAASSAVASASSAVESVSSEATASPTSDAPAATSSAVEVPANGAVRGVVGAGAVFVAGLAMLI